MFAGFLTALAAGRGGMCIQARDWDVRAAAGTNPKCAAPQSRQGAVHRREPMTQMAGIGGRFIRLRVTRGKVFGVAAAGL